jgi:hypothetical protein
MTFPFNEQSYNTLINAALANEPLEMPVDHRHLLDKRMQHEIVATRIAQNVGPLLGVPYPSGPFGEASWLCNLSDLTLQEVARGAPDPPPKERRAREKQSGVPESGWEWLGDAVYGDTPNSIAFATANRFGPDPQMAVLLTGINRLLEPQTAAVNNAIKSIYFGALSTENKLRAYAGMILGVYRPQPLLVDTGFSVRAIQRMSHSVEWPVAPNLKQRQFARCEIPAVAAKKPRPIRPFDLDLIDKTAAALTFRLPRHPRQSIVTDALVDILHKHVGHKTWEYTGDPEVRRHTVRASGDPSAVGEDFKDRVEPFTLWRNVPPL